MTTGLPCDTLPAEIEGGGVRERGVARVLVRLSVRPLSPAITVNYST